MYKTKILDLNILSYNFKDLLYSGTASPSFKLFYYYAKKKRSHKCKLHKTHTIWLIVAKRVGELCGAILNLIWNTNDPSPSESPISFTTHSFTHPGAAGGRMAGFSRAHYMNDQLDGDRRGYGPRCLPRFAKVKADYVVHAFRHLSLCGVAN